VTEPPPSAQPSRLRRLFAPVTSVFRAFRNRDFKIYWLSNSPCLVTDWMTRVAVGWLAWEMTHSPAWLGALGFAELGPSLFFGVFGGALADRFDRRNLLILCQAVQTLQSALLAVATYTGLMTIEVLVGLNLMFGMVKVLEQPVRHSLVPNLVLREDMSSAIGFDSVGFNTARIIGPAIAGVTIVAVGVGPIFVLNSIGFAIFGLGLLLVRPQPPEEPAAGAARGLASSIGEGILYVARHRGIGPLMVLLALVSMIARPMESFVPGFAGQIFNTGAEGQATLTAAMGVGASLAGIYLTQRASIMGLTMVVVMMTAALGIAIIAFIATDLFWIGVPAMAGIGFSILGTTLGSRILIQNAVTSQMRGRTASFYGLLLRGMGAVGAAVIGSVADVIGLRATFLITGSVCLIAWLWTLRIRHAIKPAIENTSKDA
jgi:MFS family permease